MKPAAPNNPQQSVPTWVLDRVFSANFRLSSYLLNAMTVNTGLASAFEVDQSQLAQLRDDLSISALIFNSPFLAYAPTLSTPEDWRSFIDGRTPTKTLVDLRKKMPELSIVDSMLLEQANRSYVGAMYDVLNMSALAAPLLGISNDLAAYLRSVPQHEIDLAISERRVPLFQWRIQNRLFWYEAVAGTLTPELVAHYLMDTSPTRADRMPHSGVWGHFQLPRLAVDGYCEAFIKLGCRAMSVATLFNVTPKRTRDLYTLLHGESSPSGKQPDSAIWYLDSGSRRVQSTFQVWLFRCALASDLNIPSAFLAAMDVSNRMFREDRLPTERALHLLRSFASNNELAIKTCRSCGTPYLASNAAARIELSNSFQCPCCTGVLSSPNAPNRKRLRGRPRLKRV
ncbi:FlhC family transcriptional regulator [Cupriavidus basilensis]|uniref:FlhC family transcriptional regulator n=1 Tax=Cupriavidus basilensis TaxID=68895 RepID=UPI0009E1F0DB|nr:FlhC family transcriptional regulator [Cupriavidus basilensis]